MKIQSYLYLALVGILLNACNWPSRNIYKTDFVDRKSVHQKIMLAQKDSLEIYATVSLADWQVYNDVKEGTAKYDSIKNSAKDSCTLRIDINTNNKGTVKINNYKIQLFYIQNGQLTDSLVFTKFCKRNEWDFQCFNKKKSLLDSLGLIGYDNMMSAQLLFNQESLNPKLFETKKLYAKIELDLKYNDWHTVIHYQDTLRREDNVKSYALHP